MQNLEELKQIAVGISQLLGSYCEVVIHDFTELEHSIVHIEGNVTGRTVGGAATDFILSCVRNNNTDADVYNYQTQLPNGRVLKSCTLFLTNDAGEVNGAFCINLDITAFYALQRFVDDFIATDDMDISETFSDDIQSTIHSVFLETLSERGYEIPVMTRQEKVDLIARLDERGVFQVKKAVPILADALRVSRSTLYNYLSETRDNRHSGKNAE